MPNGYPCPACGDADADLFEIADRPEGFDTAHGAVGCAYACESCISAARITKGVPAFFASGDLTATNHQ